ncbi:agmatine deiminase family protein [Prosthecochloris sp. SCSIO W1101]|uniref:agmatine deiminase family protein n=1 Tax=Prosthecochloris sp. SCSIO W1101 TaxID=2992242 RepID=UPI00223E8B8B|nr:agmatine deiminase family protein [Prosthecochloris sp. SCSIO W1101]UZJ42150.1 agmatine deiminase family protein [Prosthecochloris sp. SCSIO W1101]
MSTGKCSHYYMPPEWAHHDATWLSWPHNKASWPGKFEPVPDVFATIAAMLSRYETVHINVLDDAMRYDAQERIKSRLRHAEDMNRVCFHRIPTDDAWCRDHGPNYVYCRENGVSRKVILDWEYNAWGGKYKPYDNDNSVPEKIAAMQGLPLVKPGMVLEGGAIDVNGEGLLLTTEACLLNPNRNPLMAKEDIEEMLAQYLGIEKILWLKEGIVGDDTDGHVDDFARFVDERTVVIAVEENPGDENYEILQENYRLLQQCTDVRQRSLQVVKLPMPNPVYHENERLPASYANFYIANRQVLVPIYRCPKDKAALDILKKCFPSKEVVGIDCTDLVWGLGAIHCITHEEPV